MIRFIGTCEVVGSIDRVFGALADMTDLDRWNPNVVRSERVRGGRLEPGSRYRSVIKRGPFELIADTELVVVDPSRLVEYRGTISGFESVDRLTFEPTKGGTMVTFFNESRPPVWLRPATPLLNLVFQPQARRAVAGARAYLSPGE